MMENHKHWKILRMLPNLMTLSNALAGFTALLIFFYMESQGRPQFGTFLAGWFVLFAVIFDGLDGFTARKLDAESSIGLQLDSLSDFFTFGTVPPIIFAYICITSGVPALAVFASIAAGVYLCCAALRLAAYNIMALQGEGSGIFHGLPVPGAAAAVISCLVLIIRPGADPLMMWFLGAYFLVAGFLMVSRVSYMHMWKWITSEHRGIRYLLTAVFFFFLIFSLGVLEAVAVFSLVYLFSGPIRPFFSRVVSYFSSEEEQPGSTD